MAESSSPKKKLQHQHPQHSQQHLHPQKQKQRYHRLPKDDHNDEDNNLVYDIAAAHIADDENLHVNTNRKHGSQMSPSGKSIDNKQGAAAAAAGASTAKNSRSIFRSHTWTADDHPIEYSSIITNMHSNDLADTHTPTRQQRHHKRQNHVDDEDDDDIDNHNDHSIESSPLHSTVHSKSFDWDDEDEEEAGLSRYHVVVNSSGQGYLPQHYATIHINNNNNNNHASSSSSLPSILSLWRRFQQLRMSARQRRAARLLSSSEDNSCCFQCRACILTYCCDATDHGILLLFVLILLWILIGITSSSKWGGKNGNANHNNNNLDPHHQTPGPAWWWWGGGVLLFVIRVSARRLWEAMFMMYRKRSFSSADQDTMAIMMTTNITPTAMSTSTNGFRPTIITTKTGKNVPREVVSVHDDDDDDDNEEFHNDIDDDDVGNGRHPV